jgi:hypothetical protein
MITTEIRPPVAVVGQCRVTNVGAAVNLDGSASYDPDNDPLTYRWTFASIPAGSNATLLNPNGHSTSFAADIEGMYVVQFTVNDGFVNSMPATVSIYTNSAPSAQPAGPYSVDLGTALTLDGSQSFDSNVSCGDSIASYQWTIGSAITATGVAPSLPWTQLLPLGRGTFPVNLTVTDSFGTIGTATTTLSIVDNTPIANFTVNPNPAACGQAIAFDASGSSHGRPDRSIVSYEWDFENDGVFTGNGVVVTHTYSQFGTYIVRLRVTDNNVPPRTATVNATINVSLGNVAPVPQAGGPVTVHPPLQVELSGGFKKNVP